MNMKQARAGHRTARRGGEKRSLRAWVRAQFRAEASGFSAATGKLAEVLAPRR